MDFIDDLSGLVAARLARVGQGSADGPEPAIAVLLQVALHNELEAAEEAALWLTSETDLEVKLALMRQCGDEAKHYRLIDQRLRELGATPTSIVPPRSAMFGFLASLGTTAERLAAGPFAREALAQARNEVFASYCEAKGDLDTARLYREIIQPDEAHHHALGRSLLPRFVVTPEDQTRARAAVEGTLAIAEEAQEIARLTKGLAKLPGC